MLSLIAKAGAFVHVFSKSSQNWTVRLRSLGCFSLPAHWLFQLGVVHQCHFAILDWISLIFWVNPPPCNSGTWRLVSVGPFVKMNTPPKINMEPGNEWKWWFPIGISFSTGPFSGSMFVLGGVDSLSTVTGSGVDPTDNINQNKWHTSTLLKH